MESAFINTVKTDKTQSFSFISTLLLSFHVVSQLCLPAYLLYQKYAKIITIIIFMFVSL